MFFFKDESRERPQSQNQEYKHAQCGSSPDHVPVIWQVLVAEEGLVRLYPSSQEYVTWLPGVKSLPLISPLLIPVGGPQLSASTT